MDEGKREEERENGGDWNREREKWRSIERRRTEKSRTEERKEEK